MYALTRTRTSRSTIALPSGRFLLGAITPDQAAEQIFPQAKVRSGAGHNAAVRTQMVAAGQAGQIMAGSGSELAYSSPQSGCSGVSIVKPAVMNTVSGLALKFAPQAFAAGPIVGGIVLAVAGITKLFGMIFGHHAAAVAKERGVLCAAVPAANQSIELIDQMVQSGQSKPSDGIAALDAVVSGFRQAVGSIIHGADPTSSGECNAACVMLSDLRTIVLVKQSQYKDLANAQASAAASSPIAAAASSISAALQTGNFSSLLPWAAAGLGLWLVLKEA